MSSEGARASTVTHVIFRMLVGSECGICLLDLATCRMEQRRDGPA